MNTKEIKRKNIGLGGLAITKNSEANTIAKVDFVGYYKSLFLACKGALDFRTYLTKDKNYASGRSLDQN